MGTDGRTWEDKEKEGIGTLKCRLHARHSARILHALSKSWPISFSPTLDFPFSRGSVTTNDIMLREALQAN